jgi:hypothetical protein
VNQLLTVTLIIIRIISEILRSQKLLTISLKTKMDLDYLNQNQRQSCKSKSQLINLIGEEEGKLKTMVVDI